MIELVGYLGSALVVVSMLMSSVIKLRIINTVGSVIFAIYALIIRSYPTALMNFCLVAINLYNLAKLTRKDTAYDLVECSPEEGLLAYLLEHYKEDIQTYFPTFSASSGADHAYITWCHGEPAGMTLVKDEGEGRLRLFLDYTTPTYRDCSIGAHLYETLRAKGYRTLIFAEGETRAHTDYLAKMGFVKRDGAYVKELG